MSAAVENKSSAEHIDPYQLYPGEKPFFQSLFGASTAASSAGSPTAVRDVGRKAAAARSIGAAPQGFVARPGDVDLVKTHRPSEDWRRTYVGLQHEDLDMDAAAAAASGRQSVRSSIGEKPQLAAAASSSPQESSPHGITDDDRDADEFIEVQLRRMREARKSQRHAIMGEEFATVDGEVRLEALDRAFQEQIALHRGLNQALTQATTLEMEVRRAQAVAAGWQGVMHAPVEQPGPVGPQQYQPGAPRVAAAMQTAVQQQQMQRQQAAMVAPVAAAAPPPAPAASSTASASKSTKTESSSKKSKSKVSTSTSPGKPKTEIVRPEPKPKPYFKRLPRPRVITEEEAPDVAMSGAGSPEPALPTPRGARNVSIAETPNIVVHQQFSNDSIVDEADSVMRSASMVGTSLASGSGIYRSDSIVTDGSFVRQTHSSIDDDSWSRSGISRNSSVVRISYVDPHNSFRRQSTSIVDDDVRGSWGSSAGSIISTDSYTGTSSEGYHRHRSRGGGTAPADLYSQFQTMCKRAADLLDIRATLRTERRRAVLDKAGKAATRVRTAPAVQTEAEDLETRRLRDLVGKMKRDLLTLEERRVKALEKRELVRRARRMAAARARMMRDGGTALSDIIEEDDMFDASEQRSKRRKRGGGDSISEDDDFDMEFSGSGNGSIIEEDFDGSDFDGLSPSARRRLGYDDIEDDFDMYDEDDFSDGIVDEDLVDELEDVQLEVVDEDLDFMEDLEGRMIGEDEDDLDASDEEFGGGLVKRTVRRKDRQAQSGRAGDGANDAGAGERRSPHGSVVDSFDSEVVSEVGSAIDDDDDDRPLRNIRRRRNASDQDSASGAESSRRGRPRAVRSDASSIADSFGSIHSSLSSSERRFRASQAARRRGTGGSIRTDSDGSSRTIVTDSVVSSEVDSGDAGRRRSSGTSGKQRSADHKQRRRGSYDSLEDSIDDHQSSDADVESVEPRSTVHTGDSGSEFRPSEQDEDDATSFDDTSDARARRAAALRAKRWRSMQRVELRPFTDLYDPTQSTPSVSGDSYVDLVGLRDDLRIDDGEEAAGKTLASLRAAVSEAPMADLPTGHLDEETARAADELWDEEAQPMRAMPRLSVSEKESDPSASTTLSNSEDDERPLPAAAAVKRTNQLEPQDVAVSPSVKAAAARLMRGDDELLEDHSKPEAPHDDVDDGSGERPGYGQDDIIAVAHWKERQAKVLNELRGAGVAAKQPTPAKSAEMDKEEDNPTLKAADSAAAASAVHWMALDASLARFSRRTAEMPSFSGKSLMKEENDGHEGDSATQATADPLAAPLMDSTLVGRRGSDALEESDSDFYTSSSEYSNSSRSFASSTSALDASEDA